MLGQERIHHVLILMGNTLQVVYTSVPPSLTKRDALRKMLPCTDPGAPRCPRHGAISNRDCGAYLQTTASVHRPERGQPYSPSV